MQSLLAIWLTDVPRDMLIIFNEELQEVVKEMFPNYRNVSNMSYFFTLEAVVKCINGLEPAACPHMAKSHGQSRTLDFHLPSTIFIIFLQVIFLFGII